MMFKQVPLKKEHMEYLLNQKANFESKYFLLSKLDMIESDKYSVTGLLDEVPMVCGGVLQYWENRGQVWCIFNEQSKHSFVPVLRGIKKFIDNLPFRRIELSVDCDGPYTEVGVRRAKVLGFDVECLRAKKYLPAGTDCVLMAKVK
jgi:hypothetical protein